MKECIILVATKWGSSHGGINSFNTDLLSNLNKLISDKYSLYCVVNEASFDEIKNAESSGVELIPLNLNYPKNEISDELLLDIIKSIEQIGRRRILWWIGHDLITGPIALRAKKLVKHSKSAIIMHMNYGAYNIFKNANGVETYNREKHQNIMAHEADVLFAVGPKLSNHFQRERRIKNKTDVIEIIPGIPNIKGIDVPPSNFSLITYGRLDYKIERIKHGRTAAAAFGKSIGNDTGRIVFPGDPYMTVIGIPLSEIDDSSKEFLNIARDFSGGRAVAIKPMPFLSDRSQLFNILKNHSACIMPSQHEGFGLVGWEAIAAEVPLIISINSGLYQFLDEYLGGEGTGCVTAISIGGTNPGDDEFNLQDIDIISSAFQSISLNWKKNKSNARKLKSKIAPYYNWLNASRKFAKAIEIDYFEESVGEIVPNRKDHLKEILNCLRFTSIAPSRLVLFGGIASALCGDEAAKRYVDWLINKDGSQLFICYETGVSSDARAFTLDNSKLESLQGLPVNSEDRMNLKKRNVLSLQNKIKICSNNNFDLIKSRIHFIPLKLPLHNYTVIADSEIYFTPLFEKRSSITVSLQLSNSSHPLRQQILENISFHLNAADDNSSISLLRNELGFLSKESQDESN
jgi:glycosyltransferase involved in cell wall biosynthesis